MVVAELIEKLQGLDGDTLVLVSDGITLDDVRSVHAGPVCKNNPLHGVTGPYMIYGPWTEDEQRIEAVTIE